MDKKKVVIVVIVVVLVLLGVVTLSYAFFSVGGKQELANTFRSGCLNITIENESNAISLNGAYPITDVEGLSTDGYTFTIKNTCSTSSNYVINLENIDRQANTLSSDYLKVAINSDTFDNIITKLSSNEVTTPTISNAYEAYTLYKGKIEGNTTKTFKLREWIDYDATKEQAANKTITNKINVIAASNIEVEEETLGIKTTIEDTIGIGNITGNIAGIKELRVSLNIIDNDETYPFSYNEETKEYTSTNKGGTDTTVSSIAFVPKKDYANMSICYNLSSLEKNSAFQVLDMVNYQHIVDSNGGEENKCVKLGSVTTEDGILVAYASMIPDGTENPYKDEVKFYFTTQEIEVTSEVKSAKYCVSNGNACTPNIDATIINNAINIDMKDNGKQIMCISLENGRTMCSDPGIITNYLAIAEYAELGGTSFFLKGPIKRNQIKSITTLDEIKIPEGATSWDVSEKQNESVMAWYETPDSNGLYDIYIGQKGGVMANINSSSLFARLINLNSIDLSNFDTSNVQYMSSMFAGDKKLTSLDLSHFNTSNVVSMYEMFEWVESLISLDLSNFNTSKVTDMSYMFNVMESLTSLNVSNFDTSNVTNMKFMFRRTKNLTSLDLSSFDTSNVQYMSYMFEDTEQLNTLKLNKATFSSVIGYGDMFYGSSVSTIEVKDTDAKTFIEARLTDVGKSATVTISS